MTVYYNEIDPQAAAWLRELIKQGHIADGVVDERSIEDITPDELSGFTQCHFFAGIGVWSYALRQAGWPDDRQVWTGSCPCQSFSTAGKGAGFADERHLWPAWHHLISQCRPPVIFGEQVEAAVRHGWLDLVQADLEGIDYACGSVAFPAAGIGAPHIRQRLYFVADAERRAAERYGHALEAEAGGVQGASREQRLRTDTRDGDATVSVANADHTRPQGRPLLPQRASQRAAGQNGVADELADTSDLGRLGRRAGEAGVEPGEEQRPARLCATGGLANPLYAERRAQHVCGEDGHHREDGRRSQAHSESGTCGEVCRPSPTNGFWGAADWLHCTDGKWRPVEPGTFPLAHGATARVGRLRGYGNAIVAPAAQAFIEGFMSL